MQQVMLFENEEFGQMRTVNIDGNLWICLTDVCKALDLTQASKVKERLNEKGVHTIPTLTAGGIQNLLYINEPNLYRTIFQSRKEAAERFTDWVTSEVLPSIRQTGNYISEANQYSIQDIVKETICQVVPIIIQELEDKAERTKQAEREFEKLEIKVKKKIERLMYSGKHTYSDISKILAADGIELSPATICFYAESMGIME